MLLQVSGIIKRFGVDPILDGVNLQILERERIGLVGVNGAGKSTLLKIVAGEMSYDGDRFSNPKKRRWVTWLRIAGCNPIAPSGKK